MTVLNRIRTIANGASRSSSSLALEVTAQNAVAIAEGIDDIRARLDELPALIAEAQAEADAVGVLRNHVNEVVQRYTEQAASGTLKDANQLAEALRKQRELSAESDESFQQRLTKLRAEQSSLGDALRRARLDAVKKEYNDAVHAYCFAARDLPAITQRIRDAALAAGIQITPTNSPGLLYDEILINGALVTLSSPMYEHPSDQP